MKKNFSILANTGSHMLPTGQMNKEKYLRHWECFVIHIILAVILFVFSAMNTFSQNHKDKDDLSRERNKRTKQTKVYPYIAPSGVARVFRTPQEVLVVNPNVRVHPASNAQIETILFRDPLNESNMFGSAITYNYHDAPAPVQSLGVYVTHDGGWNWGPDSDRFTSTDQGTTFSDPSGIIDKDGVFTLFTISGVPTLDYLKVSYSTDRGASFSNPQSIPGFGGQNLPVDKEMANTDGIYTSPNFGTSYVACTMYPAGTGEIFAAYKTTDGGNWEGPIQVDYNLPPGNNASGVDVGVGPEGNVYLVWALLDDGNTERYIGFASSPDGGNSWSYNDKMFPFTGTSGGANDGYLMCENSIFVNSFPRIDVDKSNGPRTGWIYVVYTQMDQPGTGACTCGVNPPYQNIYQDYNVLMMYSTNKGANWLGPIKVNQNSVGDCSARWFPAIRVDEFGGINVVYYDNRGYVGQDPPYAKVWLSRSIDGASTWNDIPVSDVPFGPHGIGGGFRQGDYIGISSGVGRIVPFWMDCRTEPDNTNLYQVFTAPIDVLCPNPNLTVQAQTIYKNELVDFCAQDWIKTAGTFDIQNGGSAVFVAGNSVTLNSGFTAESGSYLSVRVAQDVPPPSLVMLGVPENKKKENTKNTVGQVPADFGLSQNYPNPFNPSTVINYALKNDVHVLIRIYDILGRLVRTLADENQTAGYKSVTWDGNNENGYSVSSGLYICELRAGTFTGRKKMVVIR